MVFHTFFENDRLETLQDRRMIDAVIVINHKLRRRVRFRNKIREFVGSGKKNEFDSLVILRHVIVDDIKQDVRVFGAEISPRIELTSKGVKRP